MRFLGRGGGRGRIVVRGEEGRGFVLRGLGGSLDCMVLTRLNDVNDPIRA